MQGFVWIGWKAGCAGATPELTITQILNPQALFYTGLNIISPAMSFLGGTQSEILKAASPFAVDQGTHLSELIVLCFGIMSIQFLYTYIEFFIVGTLCIMLLPFGALTQTSQIAKNALKSILAIGIKVMVLVFLVVIIYPIITMWQIDFKTMTVADQSGYAVAIAAIAYLFYRAPSMASGIVMGQSHLETGGFAGNAYNAISSGIGGLKNPSKSTGAASSTTQSTVNTNTGTTSSPSTTVGNDGSVASSVQWTPSSGGTNGSQQTGNGATAGNKINAKGEKNPFG